MKLILLVLLFLNTANLYASDNYPDYPDYPGYPPGDDHVPAPHDPSPNPDYSQCRAAQRERRNALLDIELQGITELTADIMGSTPETLYGSSYEMSISGTADYALELFPSQAFRLEKLSTNSFLVTVTRPELLYTQEGGLYFPRYEEIEYRISLVNQAPIPQCTDSFQKCLISVSFLYNNQLINFDEISNSFDYQFFYNDQVIELVKVKGSRVIFTRDSNDYTTVRMEMKSHSTGRTIRIESKPLAECEQNRRNDDDDIGDDDDHYPHPPRIPDTRWGRWSSWGQCTRSCGGGVQRRYRQCLSDRCDGDAVQMRACNSHDCRHDDYPTDPRHPRHPRHPDHPRRPGRRPAIDHDWMRFKSTNVDILNRDDRLLSKGFTAYYRVVTANPYPAPIECDVTLISSRGVNRDYEIIDTVVHRSVRIAAKSSSSQHGQIEGKEGRGTNGLLWTTNYGHEVKASGCRYID
ncbi:MAG: hypothetical protein CME60_09230 [Halobacteriovoraceae bacterium]|nr:hypothetical protein [Halobacteriovoraceae bacterium]